MTARSLDELNLKETEKKALIRRNIETVEQLRRFFPCKYLNYSKVIAVTPKLDGYDAAIKGKLLKCDMRELSPKNYMTTATVYGYGINGSGYYIKCTWFHNCWIIKNLRPLINEEVLLFGKFTYNKEYNNFNVVNAEVNPFDESKLTIKTVYSSMKGFDDTRLREAINNVTFETMDDYVPSKILEKTSLMSEDRAIRALHTARSINEIEKAQIRILFDDMLYFATRVEEQNQYTPKGTIYQAFSRKKMDEYIKGLPYTLTNAQSNTIEELVSLSEDARVINALVQGDVGCGKTTVAIAMLVLMAENGFQSVLMAPTVELAKQHFDEIQNVCEKLNLSCSFYSGTLTATEQKKMKESVKNGNTQIIVGTQGVINLDFNNLAMVVADEEHKYGVEQREKLLSAGVHSITMSATPIPRSIAATIYGDRKQIFVINELPSNRKPVKTLHINDSETIYKGIEVELKKGHQIYVVCPLIEESSNGRMAEVKSVSATSEEYKKRFPDYKIETLSGSMSKKDTEDIMSRYKAGEVNILIATSLIEVGISVPNATIIVIHNAERFGLAELHQLRGRVGRGSLQSYCVLQSDKDENVRIAKMIETTDGFEIAKADLEQRGMGDILGNEQSGANKYIEQAIKFPKRYESVKALAKEMIRTCDYKRFLEEYERKH